MDLMNQHLICLYRTFLSVLSALNSRENIHIIGVEIVSHIVCRYNKNKFITTHSNKKVFEQKKKCHNRTKQQCQTLYFYIIQTGQQEGQLGHTCSL